MGIRWISGSSSMRYLTTILFACIVLVSAVAYYYHGKAKSYCELWKNSEANNAYLIRERRKDHAATLAISERNKELEEASTKDKDYFDWNANISNTAVIKQLQAN